MAIKSLDKLIPGGDFSLIDINDVDLKIETIVSDEFYNPGTPDHGAKFIIEVSPSGLHANFTDHMTGTTYSGLTSNDIIEYDSGSTFYSKK